MQTAPPVRLSTHENLFGLAKLRGSRIVLAFSATALMAICAHVSLPLFFTPVPLTLQTFAVLLTGFLLGPSLSISAMLLYLAEGAMGLPVFSPAGPGGMAQLLGITGGYLLSYPFAAGLAGFVVRALAVRRSRFAAALVAGIVSTLITLVIGGLWIAHISHANWQTSATLGVAPFLPGEVIKIIAAAGAFASMRRFLRS
jgi:biotin transport system substrate-specific component